MPQAINTDYIDHTGIVMSVNPNANSVTVKIDDCGDCGDCPAGKICEATGQTENTVTIVTPHACSYKRGDIVTVRGTEQMHRKAIMYATVLPSIALIIVMVIVYLLTFNQLAAALSGIAVTIIFYVVLWACRNKIAHEFSFSITGNPERITNN
ncbi:MAG: SoxR reducing system RseC family protein [Bacteroides sp.]|nr:SoxR reducing system RseC family protein [Bacteroides sp.]